MSLFSLPLHAEEDDSWLSEEPVAEEAATPSSLRGAEGDEAISESGIAAGTSSPRNDDETTKPASLNSSEGMAGDKSLVLKLMVVNPSPKYKQTFPLKAYMPEEVKVEHILDREDLEIGYDSVKKAYYLTKEIELEPGESVVKAVRVLDVWVITEEKLNALSEEAHDVFAKLQDTEYGEQGRLLMNNIEVLLMQILERQMDETLTPNEHISVFRENKKKVYDIEMDLMAMRRFLAVAGEGLMGSSKAKSGAMPAFFSKIAETSKSGMVPGWILWRVIFIILIFLGLVSLVFVLVFQQQIRLSFSRRKLVDAVKFMARKDNEQDKAKAKQKDTELRISQFYPGLSQSKPLKKDDAA